MVTLAVPVPLRAAITHRSFVFPARLTTCVVASDECSACVVPTLTSAGASGLIALISPINPFSTVFQNVQLHACAASAAFQHRGLLPAKNASILAPLMMAS